MKYPRIPKNIIRNEEFSLVLYKIEKLIINMRVVYQLVMEFLANFKVTKAINAREAKFTPSRILEKTFELLNFGITGFSKRTNIKEGKNIVITIYTAAKRAFNVICLSDNFIS